ncbi:MAG: alternative ribosome rescue aminoacyl-tRNA hydrolase ArfB [Pseudonocardiaceae bacterium]
MPEALPVNSLVSIPEAELRWRFSRASGPGGQGVNTTDSRVELVFDVHASSAFTDRERARVLQRLSGRMVEGVLTVVASEHRSQLRNRDAARIRLAALLRAALAPDPPRRRPTRPSRAARERRLGDKHRRTLIKRLRRPNKGRPNDE